MQKASGISGDEDDELSRREEVVYTGAKPKRGRPVNQDEDGKFSCRQCSQQFGSSRQLKEHMKAEGHNCAGRAKRAQGMAATAADHEDGESELDSEEDHESTEDGGSEEDCAAEMFEIPELKKKDKVEVYWADQDSWFTGRVDKVTNSKIEVYYAVEDEVADHDLDGTWHIKKIEDNKSKNKNKNKKQRR